MVRRARRAAMSRTGCLLPLRSTPSLRPSAAAAGAEERPLALVHASGGLVASEEGPEDVCSAVISGLVQLSNCSLQKDLSDLKLVIRESKPFGRHLEQGCVAGSP